MKIIIQSIILFLVLLTFSCNNQSNNDTTDNADKIETIDKTTSIQTGIFVEETNKNFTYQPAEYNTIRLADNFRDLSELYKQLDKSFQKFNLPSNRDTAITCKEGTTVKIKANSFVFSKTGKPITGEINFQIKEYYKTSDILLANLTTTSNADILETGGMIYIEATSKGEKCELKNGVTIEIGFPYETEKDNMQLFNGSWTANKINWQLNEATTSEIIEESLVFTIVEKMPEFPGGVQKLWEFISQNVKYPGIAMERGIQGTVYIGFVINEKGGTENIRILRGVDPVLDQAALSAVEQMPKWKPGMQRGEFVKVNMNIPIRFTLGEEGFNTNDIQYTKEFEEKMDDENLAQAEMSDISRYILSTSKLGWINCDRFYRDNNPKIDYFVNVGNSKHIDIKVVFNSINSVLTGYTKDNKYYFNNVPTGHKVTLVALKYENDQYYLSIKQTQIKKGGEPELTFEPVTMAKLKTEMEKLNKI